MPTPFRGGYLTASSSPYVCRSRKRNGPPLIVTADGSGECQCACPARVRELRLARGTNLGLDLVSERAVRPSAVSAHHDVLAVLPSDDRCRLVDLISIFYGTGGS